MYGFLKLYNQYKATRKGMPNELADQMPILKDVLRAMNIKIVELEGYEADDILGTLAKWGESKGLDVTALTGDRELKWERQKQKILMKKK